jgi:hypothetical protein
MKKIRNNFLLAVGMIVGCIACRDNDVKPVEPPPSTKLDGIYDVISITCDYPVDLDRDGNFNVDLFAETHEAINMSRYYVEFNTEIYHWDPDYYDQRIFLWIPFTNVFHDEDGNFLDVKYGFTNLLAKYRYNESTRQVIILGNLGGGEVIGVHVFSDDSLEIYFTGSFFTDKGWEVLPLTGLYERKP